MGKKPRYKRQPRPKRWQSAELNDATFNMYYEMLKQMACAIYSWQGLPTEIDVRFMELTLFDRGLSVFFYDEEYDAYFALQGSPSGSVNMYNNPLSYQVFGAGGFHRNLKDTQCVPIWNNYLRRPDMNAMALYARRLADIDRTVDVNLANQKMPVIAVVPEEQRLTYENLFKQQYGNEPVVIAAEGVYDPKAVQYLSANTPFLANDLLSAKLTVWNEVMTYFGIDNANISKSSRVQAAEVHANDGQVEANRLIRLNCRRQACERINRQYPGLEVWCDMNKDFSSKNFETLMLIDPEAQSTDMTPDENPTGGGEV